MEHLPENFGVLLAEEMRAQLNNLTASIQLLTPVVREKSGGRYDEYMAIMNQSIYRLMRMINNLEYIQMPEQSAPHNKRILDIAGLSREVGEQVRTLAKQAGVDFTVEDELGSLLTQGDSEQLRRMLLNLISNAIRAAGSGGQAGLRIAGSKDRVRLTVWDNGPGLQPPPVPDGDLPDLQQRNGLGLGILVARRVAQAHGGAIVFEQREDRGLRVIVSLPVETPESTGTLMASRMGYDGHGGFSPAMVELSGVLPYRAFLPEDVE